MLGLVNDQPVMATPAPAPNQTLRMEVAGPDLKGRGRIYVKLDGQNLDFGVQFFKMDGDGLIDPRSGHFQAGKGKNIFRAVVLGQHRDFEVTA